MKVCFFVHECNLQTGHTRAMLEIFNSLPIGFIDEIKLVYFEGDSSEVLFPDFKGNVVHHKVPFKRLSPFILKSLFFQIWCFFFCRFFLEKDFLKIGIGTCCLNVDLINIQFIQKQWQPLYFKSVSPLSLKYYYKKILFLYFSFCENYLYRKEDVKFIILSQFVASFLEEHFQVSKNQFKIIYSSANIKNFGPAEENKEVLFKELVTNYPSLENIDPRKPVFLFVGAFERKGLATAIEMLKAVPSSQIIIIGKPESRNSVEFGNIISTAYIPFTKEIRRFYEIADCFIFPTVYEPFGLVLTEAAACGCLVVTNKKNVGASEILEDLDSVFFIDEKKIDLRSIESLSVLQKAENSLKVKQRLREYSWKKGAQIFKDFIAPS